MKDSIDGVPICEHYAIEVEKDAHNEGLIQSSGLCYGHHFLAQQSREKGGI